ncbi:Dabb family protein [Rhizobium sp. TRM95111]|uniref:Dabb family protein n=1 Tax=Rhizobium alarense TaxID=2846851 RepID=UPI001F15CCE4|nr:Dabb family protein [Rhizobium alarense]MCF3639682.1 Dabb family protein [Rhizobium alarense]
MIRHCVFIRFKPGLAEHLKTEIYNEITALKDRIPGFLAAHVGINVSPETGMDKGYSEGFIVDFDDTLARDAYLVDEEHRRTGAKIVAAAQGGIEGVLVYDLEIADD